MSNLNDQLCEIIEETIITLQKLLDAFVNPSDANENITNLLLPDNCIKEEDENGLSKGETDEDTNSKHEPSDVPDKK